MTNRNSDVTARMEAGGVSSGNMATIIACAAGLICFLVYLRALSCGFINFDDGDYIQNNEAIRKFDINFFLWAFTTSYIDWFIPFTWISFAVDYFFWGLNPKGYHLTNILLHAANAGLVVLIADRVLEVGQEGKHTSYRHAATLLFAALVWSLHPLRVEAVVWATARKDVLNGFFSLASLLFYLKYVRKKDLIGQGKGYVKLYWISLFLFICSLLAKPSSVIIPVLLIILDWYPLARIRTGMVLTILLEKVPFMLASAAMSFATIMSASHNNNISVITFGQKIVISGNAAFEYIRLMLFPFGIIPLYFIPAPLPALYTIKSILVLLLFITILIFHKYKIITVSWLCYIVALLPVIGFIQVGTQAFAARFTYIPALAPSIAVAALAVYGYDLSTKKWRLRPIVPTLMCGALLCGYIAITEKLIGTWKDSGRLWTRQIAYLPFDRAYFYRALFYADNGKPEAAIPDYSACLNIFENERNPEAFNLYAFRGEAYARAGRYAEAVSDFDHALGLFPHPLYYYHRGMALQALGKMSEAEADFRKAGRAQGQMFWFNK